VGPEATLEALTNSQVDELPLSKLIAGANDEPVITDAVIAPETPDAAGGTGQRSTPGLVTTCGHATS
jgi:hypothetical protein